MSLHEPDIQALMEDFPKLTRTEICDVIIRSGPMRSDVLVQLALLSSRKY